MIANIIPLVCTHKLVIRLFVCLQLSSTWSTDKKQSLLHYIAKTVKDTNPEYASFVTEMRYLQKASLVTMDNLDADIQV